MDKAKAKTKTRSMRTRVMLNIKVSNHWVTKALRINKVLDRLSATLKVFYFFTFCGAVRRGLSL